MTSIRRRARTATSISVGPRRVGDPDRAGHRATTACCGRTRRACPRSAPPRRRRARRRSRGAAPRTRRGRCVRSSSTPRRVWCSTSAVVAQELRTDGRAVHLVDRPEPVEVEHRDGQRLAGAAAAQLLTREQLGELFGAGQVLERIHRFLHRPFCSKPEILSPRGKRLAVVAEVALVRTQLPALEPRSHPSRVRAPARLRALAGARQRPRGVRATAVSRSASTPCSSLTSG